MPRNSKKAPYLGKIKLKWCTKDNLPILGKKACPHCGKPTIDVRITPPGDVRPAFSKEMQRIRRTVDKDYGNGIGTLLLPEDNIYLINKIPSLDFSEEIVADGEILGAFMYDPIRQEHLFRPRIAGGRRLVQISNSHDLKLKKTITISDDSLPFILDGKSILAPGITGISADVEKGDCCIIINKGNYVTMGISYENSDEIRQMMEINYGKACKNLKKNINKVKGNNDTEPSPISMNKAKWTWNEVFEINKDHMEKIVQEAKNFIKNASENQGKEKAKAVAYSGGKDSLAVLLLAYETLGPNFSIFFADTGLEFPEIIENTRLVAEILGMEENLIIKSAGNAFWNLVEDFGPPARDYRFCCHTLKAQQISDLISQIAGNNKVLSFLGQRRYESFSRSSEKRIYVNSFIPKQIAAAPIREWNALEVWLYILHYPHYVNDQKVDIPITSLYFEGMNRIGCYLCPATSLSLFELLREIKPEIMKKWDEWLDSYARKYEYPEEWKKFGLWRFKRLNTQWKNKLESMGVEYDLLLYKNNIPLDLAITKGFSPCAQYGGYSLKGKVNIALDLELLKAISPVIKGNAEHFKDLGVVTITDADYKINIFTDGSFFVRVGNKDFQFTRLLKKIIGAIVKSQKCNGCGVCQKICPENIIVIENDVEKGTTYPVIPAKLMQKCSQCGKCITHCPQYQKIKELIN